MAPRLEQDHPAFSTWAEVQAALARWRQRTWDGTAAAAARTHETRERVGRFLAALAIEGEVLDVGCGSGWIGELVATGTTTYAGVDPQPLSETFPFPFVRAVSDRLPFADESYDACLFFSSLDYSLAVQPTLAEAHRVLRPGGLLAVATPVHTTRVSGGERLHHHRFVAGELEACIGAAFGGRPETHAERETYHFIWTRKTP
jgi:SAM-dependent methyltransferase